MQNAENDLWTAFSRARAKQHMSSRGESREQGIRDFLGSRLPSRFQVTNGEAVDSDGATSGQLDIAIYDRYRTAPLFREASGDVLPAESLLAVIEVKSTLSQKELNECAKAAKRIHELRPHKVKFSHARQDGKDASDGRPRCQYSVVAYQTNLKGGNWCSKEWKRLQKAAKQTQLEPAGIDRLVVLDSGIIVPPSGTGRLSSDGKGMLRDWFLHLSNFLVREADRRGSFDFQHYGRRPKEPGWQRLR